MHRDFLIPFFIQNKPFTLHEFSEYHHLKPHDASVILARAIRAKDLLHILRGVYFPVSNKGLKPEESFSDPRIIVPYVFPNAIIGGWTAANYWGLTEQLFRTTLILQEPNVFRTKQNISRFQFLIYKSHLPINFAIETIWVENVEIPISDRHRTIIDMIENPKCGGGIQHSIDCFKSYLREGYDEKVLISYIAHVRNGVFFKRLGYISEILLGKNHPLAEYAHSRISKGLSPIDSSLKCNKLITRWNLYIHPEIAI